MSPSTLDKVNIAVLLLVVAFIVAVVVYFAYHPANTNGDDFGRLRW